MNWREMIEERRKKLLAKREGVREDLDRRKQEAMGLEITIATLDASIRALDEKLENVQ